MNTVIAILSSPELLTVLGGVVVTILTQAAKKIESIPLNPNNKTAVKTTAAGLSMIVVALGRYSSGTLGDQAWLTEVANALVSSLSVWAVAHMSYNTIVK